MRRLLALQREAHAVSDYTSPFLAGGRHMVQLQCFAWRAIFNGNAWLSPSHVCGRLRRHSALTAPFMCLPSAVRDKYRGHQWFCVSNTTPFDKLPSTLLAMLHATPVPTMTASIAGTGARK
jgi:hypothetical protein